MLTLDDTDRKETAQGALLAGDLHSFHFSIELAIRESETFRQGRQ